MTTDYKTQIDHVYTNSSKIIYSSGALESYFSDHKPIFVSFIWFIHLITTYTMYDYKRNRR